MMTNQLPATERPTRPASWLPDPLDDALLRYWDGRRWTFHTAQRPSPEPTRDTPRGISAPAPEPALRSDIAAALERVRGSLLGSMKEVNLLESFLQPEETVLVLTGALGEGQGVLVCTNRRLIFLFVGVIRRQVLQVYWNRARHVIYDQSTKKFAVYTTKPTRHAIPALAVRVYNLSDAQAIAHAAQTASAAPRLDII